MAKTIGQMTAEIRENVIAHGFRPAEGGPGENTWGDYIALLHSEISEALEAYRDHRLKDATGLPRCTDQRCSGFHGSNPRPGDADFRVRPQCPPEHLTPGKPEGVGSELADVLIRLLDMCDVFGIGATGYDHLTDIRSTDTWMPVRSFGEHMAWLHSEVAGAWETRERIALVLRVVLSVARKYGIDLDAEYERKMAYNRTRSYQHGGRTLSGERVTVPTAPAVTAHESLMEVFPDDPRGWWTGDEADAFITRWLHLGLPELAMQNASGEYLTLWTKDVDRAAEMLEIEHTKGGDFTIRQGEYVVCIEQAEK